MTFTCESEANYIDQADTSSVVEIEVLCLFRANYYCEVIVRLALSKHRK